MKIFLSLLLLIPFSALAQDCKLKSEKDPFTKEIKLSTGFTYFDGGSVTIDADARELNFLFNIEGPDRCFDDKTMVEFYFEGLKGKTGARNQGTMNCEGLFQLIYKNANNNPTTLLQRMLTKKITQAVFMVEGKKPLTVTFAPKEQEAFMVLANCLYSEAKKLIQ